MERFSKASLIECENHKEIFNQLGQNFRLQKKKPALILAEKKGNLSLQFQRLMVWRLESIISTFLICSTACMTADIASLQGMYPSAYYVLYVNFEDFIADIRSKTEKHPNENTWFSPGYDCDSLALENISSFLISSTLFSKINLTLTLN